MKTVAPTKPPSRTIEQRVNDLESKLNDPVWLASMLYQLLLERGKVEPTEIERDSHAT